MKKNIPLDQEFSSAKLKRKRVRENDEKIPSSSENKKIKFKARRQKFSSFFHDTISSDGISSTGSDSKDKQPTVHGNTIKEKNESLPCGSDNLPGDPNKKLRTTYDESNGNDDSDFMRFVSSNEVDHVLTPMIWKSFKRGDYDSLMNRFVDNFHREDVPGSCFIKNSLHDREKKLLLVEKVESCDTLQSTSIKGGVTSATGNIVNRNDEEDSQGRLIHSIPEKFYIALDCEMVGVGIKGSRSALARCSIVDYDGNVIYDRYIRPNEPITDYRTRWSGITFHHMRNADPVDTALCDIYKCIENRIVIGHAVYNDFEVLKKVPLNHMVRDTAQCRLLVEMAGLEGQGNALKKLALCLLDKKIQTKSKGHDSVEDAIATLELFKLVREKWEPQLFAKWQKKGIDIYQSLNSIEEEETQRSDVDYLSDKYWPSDL